MRIVKSWPTGVYWKEQHIDICSKAHWCLVCSSCSSVPIHASFGKAAGPLCKALWTLCIGAVWTLRKKCLSFEVQISPFSLSLVNCKYIQWLHWQVREVPEQETSMVLWPAKHSCLSLGWDSDRSRWHSLSWDEKVSRSNLWFSHKRRSSLGPLQRAGFGPLARLVLCCSAHFSGGGSSSWGLRKKV